MLNKIANGVLAAKGRQLKIYCRTSDFIGRIAAIWGTSALLLLPVAVLAESDPN